MADVIERKKPTATDSARGQNHTKSGNVDVDVCPWKLIAPRVNRRSTNNTTSMNRRLTLINRLSAPNSADLPLSTSLPTFNVTFLFVVSQLQLGKSANLVSGHLHVTHHSCVTCVQTRRNKIVLYLNTVSMTNSTSLQRRNIGANRT